MSDEERLPDQPTEMLLLFARPLIAVLGEPRSVDELRQVPAQRGQHHHLPVMERESVAEYETTQREFEGLLAALPDPLPSTLGAMLKERLGRFQAIPYFLVAEVQGETLEDAVLHAEARGFAA